MVRTVSVVLAVAGLSFVPLTGAQARGYHPNPPRQAPASKTEDPKPQRVSSESNGGTPEGCFRRYDSRCDQARHRSPGHREGAAN